ncbi:MAG: HNH endonuclease [Methylocystis sp.]|nr:HNH endonuclease [Methylocystis sp.]
MGLALRYRVLCRDRFRCQICGRSPAKDIGVELHVDHIIPWSKGGQNTEENLRALCFDCNLGKGAKHESL